MARVAPESSVPRLLPLSFFRNLFYSIVLITVAGLQEEHKIIIGETIFIFIIEE